ncbi:MAG: 50S ribosomal protein L24 [Elusimicrobia bacterium]|nr:50S ribosomal protein L24 [Elusimicrobiota bacterium]
MAIAPIRKKDKVLVLAGKDRGKQGDVIEVDRVKGRVLVAKVNMVKKHAKGTPQKPGGIQDKEAYLPLSKVKLVCPKCGKATRFKVGTISDGTKARVCRHCGEMIG